MKNNISKVSMVFGVGYGKTYVAISNFVDCAKYLTFNNSTGQVVRVYKSSILNYATA